MTRVVVRPSRTPRGGVRGVIVERSASFVVVQLDNGEALAFPPEWVHLEEEVAA